MQKGVTIKKGPMDWQINQQINGYAKIVLEGSWVEDPGMKNSRVFARVVREDTGESVISWLKCETYDNGSWNTVISNVPTGGLYRIETCLVNDGDNNIPLLWDLRGDMVHHFGVGDLFIIAGQSNASGYAKDPIYDPPEIGISLLKNSGRWDLASHPLNDSTNTIHSENTENANPGHSPHLNFAKVLKRKLGFPIGLVQAALGGSPFSKWDPKENGELYKNMVNTINAVGGVVKGIVWCQGSTDANWELGDTYFKRFTNMIAQLRKDLKIPQLPFLTYQTSRYVRPYEADTDRHWGMVKEAQRQASKILENVHVISVGDCMLSDYVHNNASSNMMLGERIAKMALCELYNKNFIYKGPDISKAVKTSSNEVVLHFDNVISSLYAYEVYPKDLPFTVEDEKGRLIINDYHIANKNQILLKLNRDIEGGAVVHGAYERNPKVFVPIDWESHIPMLSFYGVKIK